MGILPTILGSTLVPHLEGGDFPTGRSVPKVIYDALREAGALVQTHLDTLQAPKIGDFAVDE